MFLSFKPFFETRAVLKIGECFPIFPSFYWEIFGHVTCWVQSRVSEIIWWIIIDIYPMLYFAPRIDATPFLLHNTSAKSNDFYPKFCSMPDITLWLAFVCLAFSSIRSETSFYTMLSVVKFPHFVTWMLQWKSKLMPKQAFLWSWFVSRTEHFASTVLVCVQPCSHIKYIMANLVFRRF